MMLDLLIGILASLIAAVIVFFTATWRSVTVRRALTAVASTFLGIDVKYVFANGKQSEPVVKEAFRHSARVRVFAGRGNEFQGDFYLPLLDAAQKKARHVQILLPNPYTSPRGLDWIAQREGELATIDHSFGTGVLKTQIMTSIQFLEKHCEAEVFEIRLYDAPHIGRIVITDDFVFFTPYSRVKHGRDCRVIQYGRGDMYDAFARFFEMIWQDARGIDEAKQHATV